MTIVEGQIEPLKKLKKILDQKGITKKFFILTVFNLASQIRTFTEGTDPETSNIEALRQCLIESDRLVFLGFAYHRLNMELIEN